jgi:hypothetical protein
MARCHDNRKRRERRRLREARRLLGRRAAERARNLWLCVCGKWVEDGLHCPQCKAEPPWGCPCDWCQGERYEPGHDDEIDFDPTEYQMMLDSPVAS